MVKGEAKLRRMFEARRQHYLRERAALIEYLKVKVDARDWHAVADAANDLRVLEASHANAL